MAGCGLVMLQKCGGGVLTEQECQVPAADRDVSARVAQARFLPVHDASQSPTLPEQVAGPVVACTSVRRAGATETLGHAASPARRDPAGLAARRRAGPAAPGPAAAPGGAGPDAPAARGPPRGARAGQARRP